MEVVACFDERGGVSGLEAIVDEYEVCVCVESTGQGDADEGGQGLAVEAVDAAVIVEGGVGGETEVEVECGVLGLGSRACYEEEGCEEELVHIEILMMRRPGGRRICS